MTTSIFKLDKIVLPSSVEFVELSNQRWDAGIEQMIEYPAGHPHPMFTAVKSQKPKIEFTTPQISTLLANVGVGGASITSPITTYFKAASATGSVARATTGHKKVVLNKTLAYWNTLRLPHNGKAEVDVVLCAVWDGTNDPFVYTGSVALSGNLTAAEYFGAGPVTINGTNVPGVQSIEIASGVKLIEAGEASNVWDDFVGLEMTAPVVTIRTFEPTNWPTLGLTGTALDGTNGLKFFARKYSANGSRVANATTQHVKFVGLLGSAVPVDSSGQDAGPITDTLKCTLVSSDDSVPPLAGTVDSAIS